MANDRIYQEPVEVIVSPTSGAARLSQEPVEAIVSPTSGKARISQVAVEAIYPSSNPTTPLGGRVFIVWVG